MQKTFGFDNKAILTLAAFSGIFSMFASWWGGKFAQRFGYFTALKLGFSVMLASLAAGSQLVSLRGQILVLAGTVTGMCFTWPTIEALVSEGGTTAGLHRIGGIYNGVWGAARDLGD